MVKKYLTTRYNCGERERENLYSTKGGSYLVSSFQNLREEALNI